MIILLMFWFHDLHVKRVGVDENIGMYWYFSLAANTQFVIFLSLTFYSGFIANKSTNLFFLQYDILLQDD